MEPVVGFWDRSREKLSLRLTRQLSLGLSLAQFALSILGASAAALLYFNGELKGAFRVMIGHVLIAVFNLIVGSVLFSYAYFRVGVIGRRRISPECYKSFRRLIVSLFMVWLFLLCMGTTISCLRIYIPSMSSESKLKLPEDDSWGYTQARADFYNAFVQNNCTTDPLKCTRSSFEGSLKGWAAQTENVQGAQISCFNNDKSVHSLRNEWCKSYLGAMHQWMILFEVIEVQIWVVWAGLIIQFLLIMNASRRIKRMLLADNKPTYWRNEAVDSDICSQSSESSQTDNRKPCFLSCSGNNVGLK